jgi:hypothetical protein
MKYILCFLFSTIAFAQYQNNSVKIISGTLDSITNPIVVTMPAPPVGGSTSVLQTAANASLASMDATLALIKAKTDNLDVLLSTRTKPADAQNVTQSGVWNVGLSTGSNVIGSISNTGFGITGTLPAFAATPTFNIGTGAFVDRTTAAAPYSNRLSDGTSFYDARSIRALTSADQVTIANASIPVTGTFFQATQPVSAVSLPLPTGAATSALQTTGNTSLGTIATNTTGLATEATVTTLLKPASTLAAVTTVGTITNPVTVNAGTNLNTSSLNLESTQSALSAKVPTGLTVTSGRLQVELPAGGGGLTDTELRATPVPVSFTATNFDIRDLLFATDKVDVTGSSVSITGTPAVSLASTTISNFPATQAISAAALPLPSGAATSALQSTQDASINTLLKPASTLAAVTTVGAVTQITNALPTGTNSIGQVTANIGTTGGLALETTQVAASNKIPSVLSNDRMKVESFPLPNDLGVTAVGAAAAAVTLTLPASAGNFHYIDSIEITLYSTAARTGVAAPITCTTTNLSGNPAYTWATAGAIGTENTKQLHSANRPIKSSVANTATTFVCPAVTGGLWRMNLRYSVGL